MILALTFTLFSGAANSYFSDKNFAFFDFLGFQKKKHLQT